MDKYNSIDYKIIKYAMDESISLDSDLSDKCYTWGYADGFYHEKLFKRNIIDNEMMKAYNSGYFDGKQNRDTAQNRDYDAWVNKKNEILKIIASKDGMNGIEMREVSDQYKPFYDERYLMSKEFSNDNGKLR